MKIKILTLSLLCYFSFSNAQNFDKAKMDSLFSIIEENDKGMGSVSVFNSGEEVYQRNYGYADREHKIRSDANTKYRIGSISKTFTATLIMMLAEEGKLSLDMTLDAFYPQIDNAAKITLIHLLQHRSGILNFTGVDDYLTWHTEAHSKEQLLERIAAQKASFEPDEKIEYSNSNYVLLTFIAEDITGKSFPELLREKIIFPCGLTNTDVGGKINSNNNEAFSYSKLIDWKLEDETDMSIPLGAGALISTPTDLNTFLNCLFAGKLVNEESLEQMKTIKDGFGLGLIQVPFYDLKGYGHSGGIDGFRSGAYYFPDENMSVAITNNAEVYPLNDILIGVLSIYFGKEYQLPVFTKPISLNAEDLDVYLGVYSSSSLPLKLTLTKNGNILIAQGTGQPSFALEYVEKDKFRFEAANVLIEFLPENNKLILNQGGMSFVFEKE